MGIAEGVTGCTGPARLRRPVRRAQAALTGTLEKAEGLGAVADQEVLGLAIVIEDHLVGLTAETRFLVTTEGSARGIQVIAVGPDASGLDAAAQTIGVRAVAGPDAGTEAIGGIVGDLERFFNGGELGDREDGSKDLFLEDAHLVVAGEDGGLDVEAVLEVAAEVSLLAAGEALGTFCLADGDVLEDLLLLVLGGLWAHLGGGVERVADLDFGNARYGTFDELVEDGLVHEGARGAGADLALVEREERKAFDGLVEEVIVLIHDVGHEDVGGLAAEFEGLGDDGLGCVLHDEAAGGGFSGEGDFGDAWVAGEGFADFAAGAGDYVDDACGHDVADERHEGHEAKRCVRGWLDDGAVARGDGWRDLPCGHQQGEVPGDDLADDTHGLFEVIGDGILVDLAGSSLFGADAAGEVAEVVDSERDVGVQGLADGLAVVEGFGLGEELEVLCHAIGDPVKDGGAFGGREAGPGVLGSVGGVECELYVFRGGLGELGEVGAVDGALVDEVLAFEGGDPFAADEVVVAGANAIFTDGGDGLLEDCVLN
jgi:hypothetical protein